VKKTITIGATLITLASVTMLRASLSAQGGAERGEWLAYSGDLGSTRYSPLDRIHKGNVKNLHIAWRFNTDNLGRAADSVPEATPLMVDGVLYMTAGARRDVVALDAGTGELLWMYRLDEGQRGDKAPRKGSGRGVAYWGNGPGEGTIFVITQGYQLVALDAKTGVPRSKFGQHGIVDLKQGLDRTFDEATADIGASSPPMVVSGVVVIGAAHLSGSAPFSRTNAPGFVRGFDAATGKRLWIFHTIPMPGEQGRETWENDSASYTGNTGAWAPLTADAELGRVYIPVESPTGDYYGGHRRGNNLFANSLVCLDAKTGKRLWYYQLSHHDLWDYDLPAAPILADITVNGRRIKAVAQVTKQSWVFVFDRVTGEPVWPIVERPVKRGNAPGEWYSPTQPYPTRPAPFDRQGFSIDDVIDFTPALKAEALKILSQYTLGDLYEPAPLKNADGKKGMLRVPASNGGGNWPGAALDPETGVLYVPSMTDVSYVISLDHDAKVSDMDFTRVGPTVKGPQGLPLIKPPWGRIAAIDLNSGEHL
jgi:quinoprotein glucose dehydrogenase